MTVPVRIESDLDRHGSHGALSALAIYQAALAMTRAMSAAYSISTNVSVGRW